MTKLPRLLLLLVLLPLAGVLAACGGGVPGNAVAEVDGEAIEKSQFDEWMTVAANAAGQSGGAVPKPPEFAECVKQRREAQPEPAEGQSAPTAEELKDQCRQEYEGIRDRVMTLLVNAEWIEREAQERDISVTDEQVRKAFDEQVEQQFPKKADYREFLEQSGQTEEQLLQQVRTGELARLITEQVTEGQDEVTKADVDKYYEENKQRFAQPETRDARVVLTKTRRQAQQAASELRDGRSWRQVADEYSIDEATKEAGGRLDDIAEGTQDQGLDKALFGADVGDITGPVKTSFGYYVFEVSDVTEASQQTLEESEQTIRQALVEERRQKALSDFVEEYEERWRSETECRDGYKVPGLCENSPDPEPTPTPGAAPEQPGQGGAQPAPTPAPQD